jgi:predicted aspartyl protease
MRTHNVALQALLLLVSGSWLSIVAAEPPLEIPFHLQGGFAIVVRGSIGRQENLNFLVDTGSVPSVIHQRLARKLNLTGPRENDSVINHRRSVERVELPGLHIGPFEFPPLSAVVIDLTQIENRLGLRLDGVIGLDVLGHQNFTIDYRERKIRFGASSANGQTVPFELRTEAGAPYVIVPLEIDSHPVRLLLDTGANGLILFADRLEGRIPPFRKTGVRNDLYVDGAYAVSHVEISNVRLGGIVWSKSQAAMVEISSAAVRDSAGLFGPASLGITRIALDFDRHTLYFSVR